MLTSTPVPPGSESGYSIYWRNNQTGSRTILFYVDDDGRYKYCGMLQGP